MSVSGLETTIEEIQSALRKCSDEQLLVVAGVLNLPEIEKAKSEGKDHSYLIRLMSRYLYSEKLEEKLDQGSEVLTEVKAKLRGFNLDTVGSSTQEPTPQVQTAATVSSSRKTGENNNWGNLPWKKDFKIAGQIGEPGQKDRLSFASLAGQIEAGVKKGFSHDDVTEAVIKAIVPGSRLRNYLDGRTTISLPELRSLLRAHLPGERSNNPFSGVINSFPGTKGNSTFICVEDP